MEDSFRVRVDKAFGSLLETRAAASSSSSSRLPFSASIWSLSDEQIERKEWKRETARNPFIESNASHVDSFDSDANRAAAPGHRRDFAQQLHSDLQELEEDEEEDDEEDDDEGNDEDLQSSGKKKEKEVDDEREIRSSIGLDCTLDYEEEEDEYDKVATGRENACDRVYMRNMVDYGIDVNDDNELPTSFKQATRRDPRANHFAAKLRLREDAEAAGDFHTLKLSDVVEPGINPPKPILKKRESCTDEKSSSKRVRFHQESSVAAKKDGLDMPQMASASEDWPQMAASTPPDNRTYVPDYLRNPTRYTRYTLDSTDNMDESSNRKAYMDLLKVLNKQMQVDDDDACESFEEAPVTFTPRKRPRGTLLVKENNNHYEESKCKASSVSIAAAAGDTQDGGEEYGMDEVGTGVMLDKSSQKPGRRYRSRASVDSDDVS